MMTRRQKKSIHAFAAVLSCCTLLAGFLIFTNMSNTRATEPVVFAEILEGAVDYNDGEPAVTLSDAELTETMFADELQTFTMTLPPEYTSFSAAQASPASSAVSASYIPPADVTEPEPDVISESSPETLPLLSNEPAAHTDATTSSAAESTTSAPAVSGNVTYIITPPVTSVTTTTAATATATSVPVTTVSTTTTTTKATTTSVTTVRTTATTTSKTTTATTAGGHETEKTPFTNVGGGTFSTDTNIYLTMFRLVNNARKEAGLNELWYSARVHEICELRTTELTSYYSHTRPDGTKFSTAFKEKGFNYSVCGENIAYGKNMFKTPEEVFKAWMDSPSHRENILSPDFECAAFGLSILKVGDDTYYYWSQEFAALP